MKLINLALMALTVSVSAQSPAPAKSTIRITMAENLVVQPKPVIEPGMKAHQCYGDVTTYSLTPTFVRGLDATSNKLVLNIYSIGHVEGRELSISKPFSQVISGSLKIDTDYKSYKLKCGGACAKVKPSSPPEWYAEVLQDGKLLCSTQSKTDSKTRKMIEARVVVTEVATPTP